MGLFDWLFGKKKDAGDYQRDYRDPPREQPRQQPREQPRQQPVNPRLDPRQPQPFGGPVPRHTSPVGQRNKGLSFRRRRSREAVPAVVDQRLLHEGRDPQTGQLLGGGPLGAWGGTKDRPDPHFDARRVASHELPAIPHLDALAELIGSNRSELAWLAIRPQPATAVQGHYALFEIRKKSGGTRLLAAPLPRLKSVQRRLLDRLIAKLPLHDSVHGFRKGRDILSGASVHVGKDVVISVDIKDFFPSFTFRRVAGYFRWLGYGRGIANTLASLTTVPLWEARLPSGSGWKPAYSMQHPDLQSKSPYQNYDTKPRLPQGAPTSPALANAICWRMDKRLSALARKFGGDYTRYADDLTFSGGEDLARHSRKFLKIVRRIIATEGLELNEAKTRVIGKGHGQRVTGVIVNEQTNFPRKEFDLLKAILHNCIKHGPQNQNRENHPDFRAHLQGRIAHARHIGPERGMKLQRMFDQVRW